jgi:pre-mRNA-processing factor 40
MCVCVCVYLFFPQFTKTLCTWKEFKTETGKKYYFNSISKVTTWDMPEEYKEWLEAQKPEPAQPKSHAPFTPFMQEEPKFATHEEAVKGFKRLLIEAGMKVDWGWEQTLRAIIHSPMYRAIKTVSEKRQIYTELLEEMKGREVTDKKHAQKKLKEDLKRALKSIPDISSSSRYK